MHPVPTPSDLPVPAAARAAEFYGPPPLNPGDDRAGYETLLARLVAEVRPRGVIEEDCVRLAADTMWEAVRTRRLKAKMMTVSAEPGMRHVLRTAGVDFTEAHELAQRWAARELAAVAKVDAVLDAVGLDIHHVMAKTLALHIAEIERIDRMAAFAETRRAAALREIVLFRDATFAARLAGAVAAADAAADGELTLVPAAPAAAPAAVAAVAAA